MRPSDRIDPGHGATRGCLQVLGPLVLIAGVGFMVVGFVDFFSAFNSFGQPPDKFWCFFVGMPLVFLGTVLLRLGYMGKVARYEAGEIAPVATDTLNAVAEESGEGVATVVRAIKQGLSDEPQAKAAVACPTCREENDADARFCKSCGAVLAKLCPSCKAANDPDAHFCDKCGNELTSTG